MIKHVYCFVETAKNMSEDFAFPPPEDYFQNCNLAVGSDLRALLTTKEVVSKCEEMIQNYQFAFQKVRCLDSIV